MEPPSISPMKILTATFADPLGTLHFASRARYKCGLYLLPLTPKLVGFSCYVEDSEIPGTEAYEEAQRQLQELIDNFAKYELGEAKTDKEGYAND